MQEVYFGIGLGERLAEDDAVAPDTVEHGPGSPPPYLRTCVAVRHGSLGSNNNILTAISSRGIRTGSLANWLTKYSIYYDSFFVLLGGWRRQRNFGHGGDGQTFQML
jgi:hypothetical protein